LKIWKNILNVKIVEYFIDNKRKLTKQNKKLKIKTNTEDKIFKIHSKWKLHIWN